MQSVLRWLRRLILGALALVAIVTAIALVMAHTDWGREQLRKHAEAVLQARFSGGARVRAVEGSILGRLTVRGVELDGHDHTPLVKIGKLEVAVALWPLVFQTVQVDELVAEDVDVFVHREPLSPVSDSSSSSSSSSTSASSPWRIELPHVEIHHATIEIGAGDATQTLAEVEVAGAATVDSTGIALFGWSHGRWQGRAAELTATAAVVIDGGVHVPAALVMVRGAAQIATDVDHPGAAIAAVSATELAIDVEHPSGTIAVSAPAAVLAKFFSELEHAGIAADRLGDVAATIDIAAATPTTTRLEVNATAGKTTLGAVLHGELAAQTARGVIWAHEVDLGLVTRGKVLGHGDLFAIGHRDGTAVSLDDGSRVVATASEVEMADKRLAGKFAVVASAAGTLAPALNVAVTGVAKGDTFAVEDIAVAGSACVGAKAPACDRPRPTVEIASVRVPFVLGITPGVRTGDAPTLALGGSPVGEAVAFKDVAIAAVTGSFDARVTAGVLLGEAHLTGTGIRRDGSPFGAAHVAIETYTDGALGVDVTVQPSTKGLTISTSARVVRSATQIVAALGRSSVALPNGMIWAGRGGSIVVNDAAVTMRNVTLHNGGATVTLRGDITRSSGALTMHVDADRFMASAIDARYHGSGSGALDLTHRGSWQGDGTFTVSGLAAFADAAPIDGTAHVMIVGQRATLDAYASNPRLGRVELAFDVVAPRDPFDPSAWRALDRSAVRNATITARRVELSAVADLAGLSASGTPLTGMVDGSINLAPAELRGTFAVRGVELPNAVLDGDLTFAPHDGDLGANATARLSGIAAVGLAARFAVPERPFDPATWQYRGRDCLKDVAADLEDLAFGPELLARLGIAKLLAGYGVTAPYRGRATVELALDVAAKEARLVIDVNDVTGGVLVEPVSQHIAISAGAQGTHLRAALFRRDEDHNRGLGVLEADVPMTTDRWISEPAAVLRSPITARWMLPVTQAKSVLAMVGRHDLVGGSLEGGATIRGTLATPIVESARLVARDVAVAPRPGEPPPPAFAELEAIATWGGASGTVAITGREAAGGELHARVKGRPDVLADLTGSITAKRLDIRSIAGFLPSIASSFPGALAHAAGIVDAELALRPGGRVIGKLKVTGGALPIDAAVGLLRDATADVVLDERSITGTVDGKLGGGTIQLTADASADLTKIGVKLGLRNVSPNAALRPIITADVKAQLHLGDTRACGDDVTIAHTPLCGDVIIDHAHITVPDHADTPLLDARVPPDLVFVGAPEAVAPPRLKPPIHPWLITNVVLGPTRVEARDAAEGLGFGATLSSDKLLVSIGDTVGVRGSVAIDNADADILGRRYIVDPSELEFDGTTDPRLKIQMTHQFPELTLAVKVRGRASKLDPQFSSEPGGYSYDQLFGFFLGGEPGGDLSSQTREAVTGAGARLISGKLGRKISKVLPIKLDTISCEPATTGTTGTTGSCTFGKWLSHRLFLAYRQHLGGGPDENTGDVQFHYRLGPKVLIEGTGGDRGQYGADLLWRHRW